MPQKLDLRPVNDPIKLDLQPLDLQEDPVNDAKKFLDTTPDISNSNNSQVAASPEKGWLAKLWDKANQPLTTAPSDIASEMGNWIDERHLDENPHLAYGKGLVAGGLKGLGDLVSGLSSPLNLAITAATMGESSASKAGMGELSKGLGYVSRALSTPIAAEGMYNVQNEPTLTGKVKGAFQTLLGGMGMFHSPFTHEFGEIPKTEPSISSSVDTSTGELFDTPSTPSPAPTVNERVPSPLEIYQNYRRDSKTVGTKPLDYNKWNESGRPIVDKPISAPDPTAGTPTFGGKGKEIGARQSGDIISVKAGAGLDQVQDIVGQGYDFSHQAPDGSYVFRKSPNPTITETAVGDVRPTATGKGKVTTIDPSETRQKLGPDTDTRKKSVAAELINLPRAIMASTDMSAPLRQGLPLIHKPEFWKAIPDMVKAFGSEDAFNGIQKSIADKPLFMKRRMTLNDGTIKELPSFAEDAGLKLTDLHDLSSREEALMSSYAEKVPLFGKLYRASERSYTGFLNKLRADTFESLIRDSKVLGIDGQNNLPLARGLADFVNTATGRGSLGNLEKSAVLLNSTFFAPRLIASRLKMLNPAYYVMADPIVRKEALKSLFTVAAVGNTIGGLGKLIPGAEVESDPVSSDFGKLKIGNTRLDPFAGFQQYIVAANKLVQGREKSTTTGVTNNLGEKFGRDTRLDVTGRFVGSKLNPLYTMAIDIARGKDFTGQPVSIPEEVTSRFVPLFVQDLKTLATENPNLIPNFGDIHGQQNSYDEFHPENLPFAVPAWFGMGVQNYKSKQ